MGIYSTQCARREVAACPQNCWMVGSAKTAMRHPKYAKLPKWGPLWWVVTNKIRATLGRRIPFERYVDYGRVHRDEEIPRRASYLGSREKRALMPRDSTRYVEFKRGFFNR